VSSISIRWDRRAIKDVKGIAKAHQARIFAAVTSLRDEPLRGRALSGKWKGLRRLRVGVYRVIYAFAGEELLVSVIRAGHRRDVYR
jgi:mRNA interferase RelE/StbE